MTEAKEDGSRQPDMMIGKNFTTINRNRWSPKC